MVDEVEISNVGTRSGDTVASEATLRDLVNKLSAAGRPDLASQTSDRFKKTVKESSNVLKKLTSTAGGLTKEFASGSNRVSDFTQHMFSASGSLQRLVEYGEHLVDNFRSLSNVGASFNNSLFEMRYAATTASMSFGDFTDMVSSNSSLLSVLGGTVSNGAKLFGEFSKEIRTSNLGKELFGMGFTIQGINEGLADYLELQVRSGRDINLRDRSLRESSQAYLIQLDRLAKITGKSREEIAAQMTQQVQDAGVRRQLNQLQGEEQTNLQNILSIMNNDMPGLVEGFKDVMDGVAQTPLGQAMVTQIQGLGPLLQSSFRGEISDIDFQEQLKALQPQIDEFQSRYSKEILDSMRSGSGIAPSIAEFSDNLTELNMFMEKDLVQLAKEEGKRNRLTELLGSFNQTTQDLLSKIQTEIIESAAFQELEKLGAALASAFSDLFGSETVAGSVGSAKRGLGELTNSLIGPNGLVTSGIATTTTALNDFVDSVKSIGFKKAVMEMIFGKNTRDDGFGAQKGGLLNMLTDGFTNIFKSLSTGWTNFWEGEAGQGIKDTIVDLFTNLVDEILISISNSTGGWILGKTANKIRGNRDLESNTGTGLAYSEIARQLLENDNLTSNSGFLNLRGPNRENVAAEFGEDIALLYDNIAIAGVDLETRLIQLQRKARGFDPRTGTESGPAPTVEEQEFLRSAYASLPTRQIGTLQTTGRVSEPKDTVAKIHQGERVLNPQETAAYNNQSGVNNGLDTLNSTMKQAVSLLQYIANIETKSLKATKGMGTDLMKGIVT